MERECKIKGDVQKEKLNLENSSAGLYFVTSGKSQRWKLIWETFPCGSSPPGTEFAGVFSGDIPPLCLEEWQKSGIELSRVVRRSSLTQWNETETTSRCHKAAALEAERVSCCDTPGDLQICLPAEERAGRKWRRHAEQTIFKEHSEAPLLQILAEWSNQFASQQWALFKTATVVAWL